VSAGQTSTQTVSEIRAILQKATVAASQIPDDPGRSSADRASYMDPLMGADRRLAVLARIGQAKAKAGDVQGSLEIIKLVPETEKELIRFQVAVAQAKAGEETRAVKTAYRAS